MQTAKEDANLSDEELFQLKREHSDDLAEPSGPEENDDSSTDYLTDDSQGDSSAIKQHSSYEQVMLDVNRCAGRLKLIKQSYLHRTDDDEEPPDDLSDEFEKTSSEHICSDGRVSAKTKNAIKDRQHQRVLKRRLAKLIVRLLVKKPNLHYYQGFHDVCLTYITIYGHKQAFEKLDKLVDTHFQAFMQPTMEETQDFLALIPIILGLHDVKLRDFMEHSEVGTIFALSWTITWFSHVIPDERDVEKIFKLLEKVENPHLILYLCAELVYYKRDQLLKMEPDMSVLHHYLCQVPRKEKLPIDELLKNSLESFKRWPPSFLKEKLDEYTRAKLQLHNYNLLKSLGQTLSGFVSSPRAIFVAVIVSAMALQYIRGGA